MLLGRYSHRNTKCQTSWISPRNSFLTRNLIDLIILIFQKQSVVRVRNSTLFKQIFPFHVASFSRTMAEEARQWLYTMKIRVTSSMIDDERSGTGTSFYPSSLFPTLITIPP
jgi:hypothetical protein